MRSIKVAAGSTGIYLSCVECQKRVLVPALTDAPALARYDKSPLMADLNGKPFEAYHCAECVKVKEVA